MSVMLASIAAMGLVAGDPGGQEGQGAGPDQAEIVVEGDLLSPLRQSYGQGVVVERITIDVLTDSGGLRRSRLVLAMRREPIPAVALALGNVDPLRVFAEPGRLIAWRESDASRVYVAPLADPFGRDSLERVLPPLVVPQIDLAFGDAASPLLAVLNDPIWSLMESEGFEGYVGLSDSVSATLSVGGEGRLIGYGVRKDGRMMLRADVETIDLDSEQGIDSWFTPPSLEGILAASLADLRDAAAPVEVGQTFGDAIGVDARRRPTTLRAMAGDAESVVVLAVDAREPRSREQLAGALAEADLAEIAELLDTTVVVLALGEPRVASVFQRVVRVSRGQDQRVRVMAIDKPPHWLAAETPSAHGRAFSVEGRPWLVRGLHDVRGSDVPPFEAGEMIPSMASLAPRPLSERLAEAVGAAAREHESGGSSPARYNKKNP